jgi:hypothetical protein
MEGKHGAGKGDSYRPVDFDKYGKNYEAVFGSEKPKKKKNEKPQNTWIVPIEESMFYDLDEKTGQETMEKKCYIRIPPEVCRKMKIRVGTPLDIKVVGGTIQVRRLRGKK